MRVRDFALAFGITGAAIAASFGVASASPVPSHLGAIVRQEAGIGAGVRIGYGPADITGGTVISRTVTCKTITVYLGWRHGYLYRLPEARQWTRCKTSVDRVNPDW
jgi:hypothetical protein